MDAQATTAPSGGFRDNNIVQAWLVLCLAICFGSTLAGMQLALGPTIEQNKVNETMAKVPELVLGQELAAKMAAENQALEISPRTISVEVGGRQQSYSVFEAKYQGNSKGWVIKTGGQGYADKIELLLGLDPALTADMMPGAVKPNFLGTDVYSTVFAYRTDAIDKAPSNWAEYWDVEGFPGRRSLRKNPIDTLEQALMADGVAPADLYPLDVDRAFAKLDEIKEKIAIWWTGGAQTVSYTHLTLPTICFKCRSRWWAGQ